jgi:hypothetical protein
LERIELNENVTENVNARENVKENEKSVNIVKENVREKEKGTDGERDVVHAIDHLNDLVTDVKMVETDLVHPLHATTVDALPLETLASTQKIISITQ